MAITNAQQYQQILQKEREEKAFGGVMGKDGRRAYVGGSYGGGGWGPGAGSSGSNKGGNKGGGSGQDQGGGGGKDHGGGGGWSPGAGSPGTTPGGKNKNNSSNNSSNSSSNNQTIQEYYDDQTNLTGKNVITEKGAQEAFKKNKSLLEAYNKAQAEEEKRRKEQEEEDEKRRKEEEEKAKKEKRDQRRQETKEEKRLRQMRQKAFERFQQIEGYVDRFGDETTFAGMSGEDAARLAGYNVNEFGPPGSVEFEYDKSRFRDPVTGKINDDLTKLDKDGIEQLRYDLNVGTPEYRTAFPGYDFSINPVKNNFQSGLGTLTSTGSTTKVRPNNYGIQIPTGTSLDILSSIVRPEDGLQAFNTLEEARNIGDLTSRYAGGNDSAYDEYLDLIDRTNPTTGDGGGGDNQVMDPCKGPNPPAYCFVNNDPTDPATPEQVAMRFLGAQFEDNPFDVPTFAADGGIMRAGYMDGGMPEYQGGIMDLETGRQQYFLGKLVKKATRAIKKVAKSPFGKAALLGLGAGMAGFGPAAGLFGSGKGLAFKQMLMGSVKPGGMGNKIGGLFNFIKDNPYKSILGGSALLGLMTPKEDEDGPMDLGPGIDIAAIRENPYKYLAPRFTGYGKADGGRIGYAEGSKEPVAKETMPLLDMDGMEKDYRADGGFVPIGRMERADDVPARLSKNEFVFTADAVRNAGEGDIDKGAEVMYNMMKNLESGGEVSEESQGLDGAREMFKTSQRLEEVL